MFCCLQLYLLLFLLFLLIMNVCILMRLKRVTFRDSCIYKWWMIGSCTDQMVYRAGRGLMLLATSKDEHGKGSHRSTGPSH